MPILPYSIRGEDYDRNKDESYNMMLKEYVDNDGNVKPIYGSSNQSSKLDESLNGMMEAVAETMEIPKEIMESPHLKDLAESTAALFRGSLNLNTTNAVTESVLEDLAPKIFPYSESFGEKLKGDYETPVTPPAIMATERFENYEFQPLSAMEDQSNADLPITHADVVKENVFIGSTPLDVIMEGIETQFEDYINMEDKSNYVDIFYDQLHASYEAANDDTETFKEDMIKMLDDIQQKFIDKMVELFRVRLTITITDVESESIDLDDLEFTIRRLYEFFILGARNNFKVVIASDAKARAAQSIHDHRAYMKLINNLMTGSYSPLITTFGPMEFLKYRGDQEMIQLFETGKVAGNFLRKYSPKFYKNEEFEVEVINYITMIQQIKEEVFNNGGQQ